MRRGELPAMLSLPLLVIIIGILAATFLPQFFEILGRRQTITTSSPTSDCCAGESNTINPAVLAALNLTDTSLLIARGRYYRRAGLFDSALMDYSRAYELDSRSSDAMRGLASVFLDQDSPLSSLKYAHEAISLRASDTRALFVRMIAYGRVHAADSALADGLLLDRLVPNNACVLNELGNVYRDLGELSVAADYYSLAIALRPRHRDFYGNRYWTYYYLKDYDMAEADAALYNSLPEEKLIFR